MLFFFNFLRKLHLSQFTFWASHATERSLAFKFCLMSSPMGILSDIFVNEKSVKLFRLIAYSKSRYLRRPIHTNKHETVHATGT